MPWGGGGICFPCASHLTCSAPRATCRLGISSFGHRHYLIKGLAALKGPGHSQMHHEGASKGRNLGTRLLADLVLKHCPRRRSSTSSSFVLVPVIVVFSLLFLCNQAQQLTSLAIADPSVGVMSMLPPLPRQGQPVGSSMAPAWPDWSYKKHNEKTSQKSANLSFRDDTMGPTLTRAGMLHALVAARSSCARHEDGLSFHKISHCRQPRDAATTTLWSLF